MRALILLGKLAQRDAELASLHDLTGVVFAPKLLQSLTRRDLLFDLGVFAEGRYLYYWERPAYDIKLGVNYQFMGF